jgi:hypothetical protein
MEQKKVLHVWIHLTGESLDQLGNEIVAEVLAFVRHQLDGDQVARAVKHLLQLLLDKFREKTTLEKPLCVY